MGTNDIDVRLSDPDAGTIALVCGTNRPGSVTRLVARFLEYHYRRLGQPVRLIDLADLPRDFCAPDVYAATPPRLQPVVRALAGAAGWHVLTPEYNGGPPGVLKAFLDVLPYPDAWGKPVALTGVAAGEWGGLRPVEQLQAIFGYRESPVLPQRVLISRCNTRVSPAGEITDADLARRLEMQAAAFWDFVRRVGEPAGVEAAGAAR